MSHGEHEVFIRQAVDLSIKAVEQGNHPFGALLVSEEGEVLATSLNTVVTDCDPTRHAELSLVSDVCRRKIKVANSTLYTSCEPCMMCCGAIYWCGVRRIVFSCSHSSLAKHAGDALLVSSTSLLGPASASGVTIVGPILEELGEEPHKTFWSSLVHT